MQVARWPFETVVTPAVARASPVFLSRSFADSFQKLPVPFPRRKLANLANDGVVLLRKCREREELTRAVAISRRQFEAGECQSESEVFDEMEKMLDEMAANGDCK